MRALLFPGQGSQAVGMGRDLHDRSPAARAVFEAVDDALGERLSAVIFDGPADELTLTRNAQPALMAVSAAALAALREIADLPVERLANRVAGHSLGEYSALTAAGAFDPATAARLLRARGEAMQAAVPVGEGGMAAILGLDLATVETTLAEREVPGVCEIANDNADGQVVISGARAAVEAAAALAKDKGAKRALLLPVSAPFHCALMEPAAEAMAEVLAAARIEPPRVPVVSNVSALPETEPERIRRLLIEQVTGRVRWRETMGALAADGTTEAVEIGAGKVLAGLAKRGLPGARVRTVGTHDEVRAYAEALMAAAS